MNLAVIDNRTQSKGGKIWTTEGNGTGICLVLGDMSTSGVGLGDHFASLPCIAQLKPTIYASPFYKELYERTGCEFHSLEEIGFGFIESIKSKYAKIYEMKEWSLDHLLETRAKVTKDFNEAFASVFGIEAPREFDYAKALDAYEDKTLQEMDYCILAPFSVSANRSLVRVKELHWHLKKLGLEHIVLGSPEDRPYPLDELVSLIYNAKCVLACDSGIMHIALALGVPTVSVFGGTEPNHIIGCYEYLTGGRSLVYQKKPHRDCEAPCSFLPEYGWGRKFQCMTYAECLLEYEPEDITEQVYKFIQKG